MHHCQKHHSQKWKQAKIRTSPHIGCSPPDVCLLLCTARWLIILNGCCIHCLHGNWLKTYSLQPCLCQMWQMILMSSFRFDHLSHDALLSQEVSFDSVAIIAIEQQFLHWPTCINWILQWSMESRVQYIHSQWIRRWYTNLFGLYTVLWWSKAQIILLS